MMFWPHNYYPVWDDETEDCENEKQLKFEFESKPTKKEVKEQRKDFCKDCNNDKLYVHAMTFKCTKCHKIILGGV